MKKHDSSYFNPDRFFTHKNCLLLSAFSFPLVLCDLSSVLSVYSKIFTEIKGCLSNFLTSVFSLKDTPLSKSCLLLVQSLLTIIVLTFQLDTKYHRQKFVWCHNLHFQSKESFCTSLELFNRTTEQEQALLMTCLKCITTVAPQSIEHLNMGGFFQAQYFNHFATEPTKIVEQQLKQCYPIIPY